MRNNKDENYQKTLGGRLRQLRKDKKLTQKEVADMLNISQQSYFSWETNKSQPSSENMQKVADLFGTTPPYIMGWEAEKDELDKKIEALIKLSYDEKIVWLEPRREDSDEADKEKEKSIEVEIAKRIDGKAGIMRLGGELSFRYKYTSKIGGILIVLACGKEDKDEMLLLLGEYYSRANSDHPSHGYNVVEYAKPSEGKVELLRTLRDVVFITEEALKAKEKAEFNARFNEALKALIDSGDHD